MDVAAYRQQYAAELAKANERRTTFRQELADAASRTRPTLGDPMRDAANAEDDLSAALEILELESVGLELRLAAVRVIGDAVPARPDLIGRLIAVVRNTDQPAALRTEALRMLQQASFLGPVFAPWRAEYFDTLRSVVEDPNLKLRRDAMRVLAQEKDEYVQRRLFDGLEHRRKPLVPVAEAIQLLAYDPHAEYFALLRNIAKRPPSRAAKLEAIRGLAADPSAVGLLHRIVADKAERRDVRTVAAVALQSLAPADFESLASRKILDEDDDQRLRATFLTALAHFASPATHARDTTFVDAVRRLKRSRGSNALKRAADRYISELGR